MNTPGKLSICMVALISCVSLNAFTQERRPLGERRHGGGPAAVVVVSTTSPTIASMDATLDAPSARRKEILHAAAPQAVEFLENPERAGDLLLLQAAFEALNQEVDFARLSDTEKASLVIFLSQQ